VRLAVGYNRDVLSTSLTLLLLLQAAAPIARTAVVSGQIQTRDGNPAGAVRVSAIPAPPLNLRQSDGQNYWATQAPVSTALTNNQGAYRLPNVPPGRYYIVAGMLGQATYYPAAIEPERATVVIVESGAALAGMDVKLVFPFGGRVGGRVTPSPSADAPERAVLSGLKLEELLEVPVAADGRFDFGHLPLGAYLLSLFPTPPGARSMAFNVGEADVTSLEFVRPPVRIVSGRVVVENGPLPSTVLAFSTPQSYVNATIAADGTFRARLHRERHRAELSGLPVGYSIASVRAGAQDVTSALAVGDSDLSDVVITVAAPRSLPAVKGRVSGFAAGRLTGARVEMTGPINGRLDTEVRPDGTFEFAAVPSGLYRLRVPQLPELAPLTVVVDSRGADVQFTAR
jgi:hypothetical protein